MTKSAKTGTLYMIPLPVADGANHTLSAEVSMTTERLRYYFAENARTARRFLRSLHAGLVLEEVHISEIDKHTGPDMAQLRSWLKEGKEVGVVSEAGCPGIADPGSALAAVAHNMGVNVVPLTGPSSILLALMASGLSGQNFAFNGYLPLKEPARSKKIKDLEAISQGQKQTQIFIETPYRNNSLLADLLRVCSNRTRICIAVNVTAPGESIITKSAGDWKQQIPVLEKEPVVFLMQG
jgi:16S rRNA (cytidine1402-2'-O)-methyltransferase